MHHVLPMHGVKPDVFATGTFSIATVDFCNSGHCDTNDRFTVKSRKDILERHVEPILNDKNATEMHEKGKLCFVFR